MAIGDIIVGIDIGTSKVSTVVGEVNNFSQIETICSTSNKCNGLKKGKIINEEEISQLLGKEFRMIVKMIKNFENKMEKIQESITKPPSGVFT